MKGKENLRTPTSEEAKEMQRKSAEKRKENNAKKKGYDRFRVFYFYEGKE